MEGGLTHLQYADDTVLFFQQSEENIAHVKFLLFCFEELSGMKINYMKSEVFTIGLTQDESQKIAEAFNCKLGAFPMKYLGLPISDRRLSKGELSDSVDKVEKTTDMEMWTFIFRG